MENKKYQVKDLCDKDILQILMDDYDVISGTPKKYLSILKQNVHGNISFYQVIDDEVPEKVLRAKLVKMVEEEKIGGCICGCGGKFYIKPKGIECLKDILSSEFLDKHSLNTDTMLKEISDDFIEAVSNEMLEMEKRKTT